MGTMYDTILVPTDGSEHARRAAEHALSLATAFDARVHVVNVVDVQGESGPFNAGGVGDAFVERLEGSGTEAIEDVESLATERNGGTLETALVRGDPGEAILTYVADNGIDLIAMGTHGRTGVERYLTGSICEHVVRNASVPVLTTRSTAASELDGTYDVMIPTDGSQAAGAAVPHGIAIGEAFDARVHAVNVIDLGDVSASSELTIPSDLIDSLQNRGEDATDSVAAAAEEAGLAAVTEVRGGFPAQDLLEYADEEGIDLIAMGTAGRTGLSRFLMGSTTERLVRHAEVPVVSVNAGNVDEREADR